MTNASNAEHVWELAADKYQQIVAEGGDPESAPAFEGTPKALMTIKMIVAARESQRTGHAKGDRPAG
jgi:hypothetical protein